MKLSASTIPGIVVAFMAASPVAMAGAWGDGSFENDDALDWPATCSELWDPVKPAKWITVITDLESRLK